MSLLFNQTNITTKDYFFLVANISTLTATNIEAFRVSTGILDAGVGTVSSLASHSLSTSHLFTESISSLYTETNYIEVSTAAVLFGNISSIVTNNITLDGNTIDTGGAGFGAVLLLNGLPIATGTSSLSSIQDWSFFPAVSTLQMSMNNIANAGNITCQNIYNALNIQTDTLAALTSYTAPTGIVTNLRTTNLSSVTSVTSNLVVGSNVLSPLGQFLTLSTGVERARGVSSLSVSTGTINGTPYISGSNWSVYPATSAVSMNQNPLNGGSNFAINCSNLVITASNSFSNLCDDFTVLADEGANVASIASINLTAQNGTYGAVNITANGGFNNAINGVVNITANGSQLAGVGQGGSVNITANTPIGFSNLTSKISLNASGINSYAGVVPPFASLLGYNFIYGTAGVNITTGIPSLLPNLPLTTYLYGTNGIVLNSDVYTSALYPYWDGISPSNGDLSIQGRVVNLTNQVYVTLSNVKFLDMDFFALIRQVKGITFCNTWSNNYISNADTIQGSNTISGYTSISGTTVSGTTVSFTTATGGTVTATNITASNLLSTTQLNTSSIRGFGLQTTLATISTLTTSSLTSPVYGSEFRLINTLPGSSQGGSGPTSVCRLIAEKPSGVSTIAQIVAADSGMTVAAFKKDGTLTNMFLNASTISQSFNNTIVSTIRQPLIQYSTIQTSGGSGNQQVQFPLAYKDTTYASHATMNDTTPAQMAVQNDSRSSMTIYWANAGGGNHTICWTTYGDL